jgi:YspA, cpYpsA-related SLOG family
VTRIIVAGSRHLGNRIDVWGALDQQLAEHGPFTLVVGDCPTGADAHARAKTLLAEVAE